MKIGKALLVAMALVAMALPAQATSISYELNYEFSGAATPSGSVLVTFDDQGTAGDVQVTISAANLSGTEFIDDIYINYNPSLNVAGLSFSWVSGQKYNSVLTGTNAYQADGDGKFDIVFDYPPPPGTFAAKFTSGETSVYNILGAGITANDFAFSSVESAGNGSYHVAAHVQGIAAAPGSGWIGDKPEDVPEGGTTLSLLGGALLGLGLLRRRFNL